MSKPVIVVAAGVILNTNKSQVLLSFRHSHLDQGGLWEYPGGKVEPTEEVVEALSRELREELAIEPLKTTELCVVTHDYGKKIVELHFMVVEAFSGEPMAMESQDFKWIDVADLASVAFPEANQGVAEELSRWLQNRPSN